MRKSAPFALLNPEEICLELGRRIRDQRVARNWTQDELCARTGLGRATLHRIETEGSGTFKSWVKLMASLGARGELERLMADVPRTLDEIERLEQAVTRKRVRKAKP